MGKVTKIILELAISTFIGIVVGILISVIISWSVGFLVASGLVGFIVSCIVAGITEGKATSKLYTVFSFIVSAGLYLVCLLGLSDNNLMTIYMILHFLPYVVTAYVTLVWANKE